MHAILISQFQAFVTNILCEVALGIVAIFGAISAYYGIVLRNGMDFSNDASILHEVSHPEVGVFPLKPKSTRISRALSFSDQSSNSGFELLLDSEPNDIPISDFIYNNRIPNLIKPVNPPLSYDEVQALMKSWKLVGVKPVAA